MAQKTREELNAANAALFVNNETGDITPDEERAFNEDVNDSAVNIKGDTFAADAEFAFQNGSKFREGAIPHGFGGGIARVCANEKADQWEDGFRYLIETVGSTNTVVYAETINDIIPDDTYDETDSWAVGSRLKNLVTGIEYLCTQANEGDAIWIPISTDSAYNIVTKAEFDNLVAASALIAGQWYEITDATWLSETVSVLVIAIGSSQINSQFAYLGGISPNQYIQGFLTGGDVNSFLATSGVIQLSASQCVDYGSGIHGSVPIFITPQFSTTTSDDGAKILTTNVTNLSTGELGSLDPTFTTFTPFSGDWVPEITGGDSTTLVAARYSVQGNVVTFVVEFELDNSVTVSDDVLVTISYPDGLLASSTIGDEATNAVWSSRISFIYLNGYSDINIKNGGLGIYMQIQMTTYTITESFSFVISGQYTL